MKNDTKSQKTIPASLSNLNPKCAGIDVGASELFVCIAKEDSKQEVRSFSTFTADLKQMIGWLKKNGVKSVAMESTGSYWIVPYEMMEEAGLEVLLVNAKFFRAVPGRKTDVKDCQWIQQLHSYGLLSGSFRPSKDIIELRAYVRQRSRLFASGATQVQLMHKALIQMNIQLNHVISDITGVTGMKIIKAILRGERNPLILSDLSEGSCRKKRDVIAKALEGNYREEHLLALKQACEAYEFFHRQVHECEEAIEKTLHKIQKEQGEEERGSVEAKQSPLKKSKIKKAYNRSPYHFDAAVEMKQITKSDLTTIPGISESTAMTILSEIGTDMSRWRNAKAFVSWLGLCPGNKISGGKVLSSKTKPSDNKVGQALRLAAFALYRSSCYLGGFFRRMRARLGSPKAITATAHKLAKILYSMLSRGEDYRELGENYYEQQHQSRVMANLQRKAKEMGYTLVPVEV